MIRPIDIRLNAAHPELPLAEAVTYTGAPSTILIRGVPPNCGRWAITAVFVAASFPDGSTSTRAAVQSANGVWVATLPATATSGRTANGVRIMADGIDEHGEAVTGYILGVADFAVASLDIAPAPAPGGTNYQMIYFDTMPATLRKGDVTKIDGALKFYNGTAWEPFAAPVTAEQIGAVPVGVLANYYTAKQIDEAISERREKTDLNVYGYGNASVTFPDGFSISYSVFEDFRYSAPPGGETIEFYGPISSTADHTRKFWVPYAYKDATDFDPSIQRVWCLFCHPEESSPFALMLNVGPYYVIDQFNSENPTLTLIIGKATGGDPTMTRPIVAIGDDLAKVSQVNTATEPLEQAIKSKADRASLALEYSETSAYPVGSIVYHDGNIYQCTTAIAEGGEAWNAAHWELMKLSDFFTASNSLLTGTIDARLPYPLYAVPSTGLLKDRAINTTSLASVTVPNNFTDLLIRASVASSLSVTMPGAFTKYGDTFPGEAGEYLITITKTGAAEAYVRTIKLEEVA